MTKFDKTLLEWYDKNHRVLPWRENPTPYKVWLSEIMLQQTRIEAVKDRYIRFLEAFPSVFDLAAASEDEVLKLWEGLGYYSRARNLHKTAQIVVLEHNGEFPEEPKLLRKLPGIGVYTANAIAAIRNYVPTVVATTNSDSPLAVQEVSA